jgi:hypothetical protein
LIAVVNASAILIMSLTSLDDSCSSKYRIVSLENYIYK